MSKFEISSIASIIGYELGITCKSKSNMETDIASVHKTSMKSMLQITSEDDVRDILENTNNIMSFLGTGHTMGGHTLIEDGIRIDTKSFNKILSINLNEKTVTIQPGITWSDLIKYCNNFGMSPKSLQSYSGFTVGGSIFGPNAHGILSDYNIGHSVISFKIMFANGEHYLVKSGDPLFNICIGSFGAYGFVYEITLKIVQNDKLDYITIPLKIENGFQHFQDLIFKGDHTLDNSSDRTLVKFIRLNSTLSKMTLYKYEHTSNVVSSLAKDPPSLSYFSTVVFHWCAHLTSFRLLKGYWENLFKIHSDAVYKPEQITLVDRNVFAYESAEMISGKLTHLNATHVLQEYFVPFSNDIPYQFIATLKSIYANSKEVELLNTTARIVKKDEYNFIMSYSPNTDMCAFVLYIRLGLTQSALDELKQKQLELNDFVVQNGGTFYLTYLHHYTKNQVLKAYPNVLLYLKLKQYFDPKERFQNIWFNNLKKIFEDELNTYQLNINFEEMLKGSLKLENCKDNCNFVHNQIIKRDDVIKKLMQSEHLKNSFKLFLEHVFIIHDKNLVMNILYKCCHLKDKEIYCEYLLPFFKSQTQIFNLLKFGFNAKSALEIQLREMHSQISKIL